MLIDFASSNVSSNEKLKKKMIIGCLGDTEQLLVVVCNVTDMRILLDLIQGQESQQVTPDPVLQKQ